MDMSATSSMAGMAASSTMSGMAAATSGMSMDMGGDTDTSMGMSMVFFSAINTSLFSSDWTPSTTGQYAGTCIFLIVFALIFRALLALRSCLEATAWANSHTRGIPLLGSRHYHDTSSDDKAAMNGILSAWTERPPWQLRVDGWRAVLDTILVGVGYLLMLAVMTLNVGYFASVLGGTFLGSAVLGRFSSQGGAVC